MLSNEDLKFWIMGLTLGITGKPCPLPIPDTISSYLLNNMSDMLVVNDPNSLAFHFTWSDMKMNVEVKN